MKVSEIFYSLQGEGCSAGCPAIFIRLAGCNLSCSYCDSVYAQSSGQGKEMSCDEVVDAIGRLWSKHFRSQQHFLVVTGGEPLLQADAVVNVLNMWNAFRLPKHIVEIETNGTLLPLAIDSLPAWEVRWNVSPKLANSGNSIEARRNIDVLNSFAERSHSWFKFVIDLEDVCGFHPLHPLHVRFQAQFDEINDLRVKAGIKNEQIILMPMTTLVKKEQNPIFPSSSAESKYVVEQYWRGHQKVAQIALGLGYRFSPRLHIMAGLR